MVVLTQVALDKFSLIKTHKQSSNLVNQIPVIDLKSPQAKTLIVKACEEFGFFKLVNHGVPLDFMAKVESQAVKFFSLPQSAKDKAGPADPFGYGNKRIGPNGDIGWVEYLLFSASPDSISHKIFSVFRENPENFRAAVNDYIAEVKRATFEVLELIADELNIEPRNTLSKMLRDDKSDSFFRLNHYPPCPDSLQAISGRNLLGFGEHTDPQLMSVLRSNNTSGLQIRIKDGSWVSVPSDHTSLFLSVGDSLQVFTNGRFKSIKHRVLAESKKSRVSMIYFGGPALNQKIAPISSLVGKGEESLYKEFTWSEYKKSAYNSRLADNRLACFMKNVPLQKMCFLVKLPFFEKKIRFEMVESRTQRN